VSRILDGLRRARRPTAVERSFKTKPAEADAVLATLGYKPEQPRRRISATRALSALAVVCALGVAGWSYLDRAQNSPEFPPHPAPHSAAAAAVVNPTPPEAAAIVTPPVQAAKPTADNPPAPHKVVQPNRDVARTTAAVPADRQASLVTAVDEPATAARPAPASAPAKAAASLETQPQQASRFPAPRAVPVDRSGGAPGATGPDHFKMAVYYHRAGDFESALIHYRAVLANDEMNAEAHNNLGVLYKDKGLLDEAIREFNRAIFIDQTYEKAHNNLGVALLRSGKIDAAVAEFRWLLSRDSRNVEAMVNLALAHKASGHPQEARETLIAALSVDTRHAASHYNIALLYEEDGEYSKAVEHFEAFLKNAGSEHAAVTAEVRTRVQVLKGRIIQ
jgi:Tfp pilus assembly protein PilF